MSKNPAIKAFNTGNPASSAYPAVRERWPKILDAAINDVELSLSTCRTLSDADIRAGRVIQLYLTELKIEMAKDAALAPVPDDGEADVGGYNEELTALNNVHGSQLRVCMQHITCTGSSTPSSRLRRHSGKPTTFLAIARDRVSPEVRMARSNSSSIFKRYVESSQVVIALITKRRKPSRRND